MKGFLLLIYCFTIIFCISGLFDLNKENQWYNLEVRRINWQGCPPVDYSTSPTLSRAYTGKVSEHFRKENERMIDSLLFAGDTLTIGCDFMTNSVYCTPMFQKYFTKEYHSRVIWRLNSNQVLILTLWLKDNKYEFINRWL